MTIKTFRFKGKTVEEKAVALMILRPDLTFEQAKKLVEERVDKSGQDGV